jgi:hypothetical protein
VPYGEDPVGRIVNVAWGRELLLEFLLFHFDQGTPPFDVAACPAGAPDFTNVLDAQYAAVWKVKAGETVPDSLGWGGTITGNVSEAVADFSGTCTSVNETIRMTKIGAYYYGNGTSASGAEQWQFMSSAGIAAALGFQSGEECTYAW